jgi:hypothetical protein
MNAFIRLTALVSLAAAAACGGAPSEDVGTSTEDSTYLPGLSGYWQIDTANPTAGEITLLSLSADGTFWGKRCADDACAAPDSPAGTYKRTKTRLRFYDSNRALLGVFSYVLDAAGTLRLREIGTYDRYALDTMSESLCDQSGGGWSDDDLAAHGFNCSCPDAVDWGPGGCASCPYGSCGPTCTPPLSPCGSQCVDLSSDPTNCGACSATCTKAQSCVNGACQ